MILEYPRLGRKEDERDIDSQESPCATPTTRSLHPPGRGVVEGEAEGQQPAFLGSRRVFGRDNVLAQDGLEQFP